jgi:hypothetical protein
VEKAGAALCERTLSEVFGASSARGAAAGLEEVPSSSTKSPRLGEEAGHDWCLKRDDDAQPLTLLSAIGDGFLWPLGLSAAGDSGGGGEKKKKAGSARGGPQRACHRIALFNNNDPDEEKKRPRLSGLLSQSDALAWLVDASASSPALRKLLLLCPKS